MLGCAPPFRNIDGREEPHHSINTGGRILASYRCVLWLFFGVGLDDNSVELCFILSSEPLHTY